jgi:hypothetical protein
MRNSRNPIGRSCEARVILATERTSLSPTCSLTASRALLRSGEKLPDRVDELQP